MRLGSPSSAEKATSPSSTASPASRLLSKLKSIASNKAAASASGDDGVPKTAAATTSPSSGSSSSAMDSADTNARASDTPPLPSRGPSASGPSASSASSLPAGSKTQAAAATTSNKKPSSQPQGSAWQCYRESRLSKLAKWLQIFLVSLFFVALYCGDLTPASMKSTAVFQGFSTQLAKLSEAASSSMPAIPMPSFSFAFLPARLPLPRRFGFRAAWNTVTDTIPPQVPIMTPMQSPALKRGAVLYAGDYIYSCVAPKNNKQDNKDKECQPTFLHLKDDGTLVLAHGSTPSKPYREIWASKTPKPCKNKGCSKKCACQGQYEAVYGEDGALEVRQGDGKRVWRKRKWLQPKVLRPWPLTN